MYTARKHPLWQKCGQQRSTVHSLISTFFVCLHNHWILQIFCIWISWHYMGHSKKKCVCRAYGNSDQTAKLHNLIKPLLFFNIQLTLVISTSLILNNSLSRITAYLEVKSWSLPKDENLTIGNKILWKKRRNCSKGAISPLFHNIFNISRISRVQLHIHLLNVVVRFIFSSILQFWYVEVRISRSISESPLEFEITRVDCILQYPMIL